MDGWWCLPKLAQLTNLVLAWMHVERWGMHILVQHSVVLCNVYVWLAVCSVLGIAARKYW